MLINLSITVILLYFLILFYFLYFIIDYVLLIFFSLQAFGIVLEPSDIREVHPISDEPIKDSGATKNRIIMNLINNKEGSPWSRLISRASSHQRLCRQNKLYINVWQISFDSLIFRVSVCLIWALGYILFPILTSSE